MLAHPDWRGEEIECPYCICGVRLPADASESDGAARTEPPSLKARRFFNFPCPACDVLVEGNDWLSGREAECPACGARFEVPGLRANHKPALARLIEAPESAVEAQAYGASGIEAPEIGSDDEGNPVIICPRCNEGNEIDADACANCDTPFTAAGVQGGQRYRASGLSIAGLIVAGFAMLTFYLLLPAIVALGLALADIGRRPIGRARTFDIITFALAGFSLIVGVAYHIYA
jgi:hypothetical protein